MTEEEIINKVKELIEDYKSYFDKELLNNTIKAIQGLLDLYNKEKEKNKKVEEKRKNGTLDDGYHSYNDLYYQRCVLFSVICNLNKNIS